MSQMIDYVSKDVLIQERINSYLTLGIALARATFDGDEIRCGYCDTLICNDEEHKPNFCSECGSLIDYTKEEDEGKSCGNCQYFMFSDYTQEKYFCIRNQEFIENCPKDFGEKCPYWKEDK